MAERRLRVALQAVIADPTAPSGQRTPTPDHAWYDNARTDPRSTLPCEREREMLHAAIRQGCTTPLKVVSYFVERIADTLAQFPEQLLVSDVLYVRLMIDEAEALEAQALAHGVPTPEHIADAIVQTREAIVMQQLECALLEKRGAAFPRPMSVPV